MNRFNDERERMQGSDRVRVRTERTKPVARVCFVSRIRPDQIETYRQRHAEVWPEMVQALHETGWRGYTLHLAPDGLLVGVVDVDDFDAARDAMAAREVNARWQAEMAGLFGSDGPPDQGFVQLECVFDLDAQLAAARGRG